MSEEKLYAVKNDEGKYWNFADRDGFFEIGFASCSATDDERYAKNVVRDHGGHVVTFNEEPEKVLLSKEQAKIVEDANKYKFPASYISMNTDDYDGLEKLLMNALVNGYTVKKEKKYLLPMDGTLEENDDNDNFQLYAYCYKGRWLTDECETDPSYLHFTVTQKELETAPAWVKAINPVEVTDDEQ
ncbi:DUF1642 domain-containing protein [Lacticaseibacillus paracasei]|uniref:DUF1642 domain-containing protein n=1 Tax=Lacticaseibacillus paracasei TaxID=1597 RepID=UPI0031F673DF